MVHARENSGNRAGPVHRDRRLHQAGRALILRRRIYGVAASSFFLAACIPSTAAETRPVPPPFIVTGLQNVAVRLNSPAEESSRLWMGDVLGSSPETDRVRVDPEGILALRKADPMRGELNVECGEYSQLSISNTQFIFLGGRIRVLTAALPPAGNDSGPAEFSIRSAFGELTFSPGSMVEIESSGGRTLIFCLYGAARVRHAAGGEIAVQGGEMTQVSARGKTQPRAIPPEMQLLLASRPRLGIRYAPAGTAAPRVVLFSPRSGRTSDRETIRCSGRVDLTRGPVQVRIGSAAVSVQPGGWFSATHKLLNTADTVTIVFKNENSSGTLTLRTGYDRTAPRFVLDPVSETTSLKESLISGTIDEAAAVMVSGKTVQTRDLRFSQFVPLSPGPNAIPVVLVDRAGNRSDALVKVFRTSSGTEPRRAESTSPAPEEKPLRPPAIASHGWKENGYKIEFGAPAPSRERYIVRRGYSTEGPFVQVGESSQQSFIDPEPILPGMNVYYRAALSDESGRESPMSDPILVSAPPSSLAAPSPVTFKIDAGKIRLFWPKAPAGEVGGYNVYWIQPGSSTRIASVPFPPYVMDWPDTSVELAFRVAALSAFSPDESAWSDTVYVRRPPKNSP